MNKKTFGRLITGLALVFAVWTTAAAWNPQQPTSAQQAKPDQQAPPPQGAQQPPRPNDRAMGAVASVGVDRFEIKRMDGSAQTVMVNDQTRYVEGERDAEKNFHLEDLKPGDHVFVRGKPSDSGELIASMVRRITPEQMQRFSGERAGGEIISINGNQLTVRNPRQGEKTIVVNDQTTFLKDGQPIALKDLKVGDRIFALGKESDGQFVATRVLTGQFRRGGDGGRYPHDNN